MKKFLLIVIGLTMINIPLHALSKDDIGVGVMVGDPIGITAKYWFNDTRAIDMGMGFSPDLKIYGDYLWHSWNAFPQPSQGKLGADIGLGTRLVFAHDDTHLGLRMVAGLTYWIPNKPIEIFAEVAPVLEVSPQTTTDLDGGVGVRFYFPVTPVQAR